MKDDVWTMCFGIVKGKMPAKGVWMINAKDPESAIRQAKKSALSNFRDTYKQVTLFLNGHVAGWVFKCDGKIIYVNKYLLEDIKLIPKSRK